jgi:hypothetical protein
MAQQFETVMLLYIFFFGETARTALKRFFLVQSDR